MDSNGSTSPISKIQRSNHRKKIEKKNGQHFPLSSRIQRSNHRKKIDKKKWTAFPPIIKNTKVESPKIFEKKMDSTSPCYQNLKVESPKKNEKNGQHFPLLPHKISETTRPQNFSQKNGHYFPAKRSESVLEVVEHGPIGR